MVWEWSDGTYTQVVGMYMVEIGIVISNVSAAMLINFVDRQKGPKQGKGDLNRAKST